MAVRHPGRSILGDIPGDWDVIELRRLLSDNFSGDWGEDSGSKSIAVLRSTNFSDSGRLALNDVAYRYFDGRTAEKLQVQQDDILLERSGGGINTPVGRVVRISTALPETGFANFVQLLRPNSKLIHPAYLFWVLYRFHMSGVIERLQHQTTQMRNLDLRDYLRVLVPFPTKDEQERIADALNAADEYFFSIQEKVNCAARLLVATEQSALGASDHNYSAHSPYKCGTQDAIRPEWESSSLGNLADIDAGVTLNQDRLPNGNPVRYLTVVNVRRGRVDLSEVRYLELRPSEEESKRLAVDDVLVVEGHASSSEIGRAAIVTKEAESLAFQNHLFRVRVRDRSVITPSFLCRTLNSERVRRYWVAVANTSSGLNTINRTMLRNLAVPHPLTGVQETIQQSLEAAERYRDALLEQLCIAVTLKKGLLQNLLTGKVRL